MTFIDPGRLRECDPVLEVTAYTTYAGLWLLPVMLPILIVGLDWLGLKSMLSTVYAVAKIPTAPQPAPGFRVRAF